MPSCARCGAPTPAPHAPCPACGAPAAARGPTGGSVPPIVILLLVAVTFGVYAFGYWWTASRQADAHLRPERPSHPRVRAGTLLLALSMAPALVSSVLAVGAGGDTFEEPPPEPRGLAEPLVLALVVSLAVTALVALAGLVLVSLGLLRLWRNLGHEDRANGRRPLRPGVQLFLLACPYVNLVGMWFVLYRTQRRLNRMWDAAAAPA